MEKLMTMFWTIANLEISTEYISFKLYQPMVFGFIVVVIFGIIKGGGKDG